MDTSSDVEDKVMMLIKILWIYTIHNSFVIEIRWTFKIPLTSFIIIFNIYVTQNKCPWYHFDFGFEIFDKQTNKETQHLQKVLRQVQMGIVITHVVELNFEKSYITLNVEFLMRWKVTDICICICLYTCPSSRSVLSSSWGGRSIIFIFNFYDLIWLYMIINDISF